jgi:hypothetical protein
MEIHPESKETAVHVFDGKPKLDQRKVRVKMSYHFFVSSTKQR